MLTRRAFLGAGARGACVLGLGGAAAALLARQASKGDAVWQIDPDKCTACGNCANYCVLRPSAAKCVHAFPMCGYCERCFGYFDPQATDFHSGAENQLCPSGAIQRAFVEEPYYQYTIDERLCIACGKCVKGCRTFGNGSLILQIRHDRCVNCNECSIAAACPADAVRRVPAAQPHILPANCPKEPPDKKGKPS